MCRRMQGRSQRRAGTVRLNADREREVLIECAVGMVLVMQASRMALSGRLWYTLPYRIRISRPRGGAARIVTVSVNGPKAGRVGSRTARYAVTWNATTRLYLVNAESERHSEEIVIKQGNELVRLRCSRARSPSSRAPWTARRARTPAHRARWTKSTPCPLCAVTRRASQSSRSRQRERRR